MLRLRWEKKWERVKDPLECKKKYKLLVDRWLLTVQFRVKRGMEDWVYRFVDLL